MTISPQTTQDREQSKYLNYYLWGISLLGVLLFIRAMADTLSYSINALIFVILVIVADLFTRSDLFTDEMVFSISSAVTFATLILFGPYVAAIAASSGGIIVTFALYIKNRERKRQSTLFQRVLFNMASIGIPAAVAGWVYQFLGGAVGDVSAVSNLLPIAISAFALEFGNAAIVIGAVAIQTRTRPFTIWRRNASWAVPINILTMAIGGGGMAYAFQLAGYVGVAIFFVPIAMTVYSVRLYVQQTKQQMEQLEQTVKDRTADLQKAYDDLQQLDQTKTAFYAIVNHEMRSPLTAIIGYADLLRMDKTLTEDQLRQVDAIRKNSRRVTDLVKDILDISRIEDGKLQILQEHTPLIPIIEDAISTVQPAANSKLIKISFESTLTPETTVYADPKRVAQVAINLLSNAVKFTPETGTVDVAVHYNSHKNLVQVDVIDTGVGIPEDVLPVIFDRFSRAERKAIKGVSGTGLGLAIAKGLIEAHHGDIWARSIDGEGSTFSFTLPTMVPESETISANDSTVDTESHRSM